MGMASANINDKNRNCAIETLKNFLKYSLIPTSACFFAKAIISWQLANIFLLQNNACFISYNA